MLNVPAHWRIKPSFSELSAFGAGDYGRPLRILVDSATVPPSPALELLREFSGRPGVAVFATNDPALGSIRIGAPDGADERLFVTYSAKSEGREATLFAASSWREHSRRSAAEHGLDAQETWRGLILAQACRRHEIDALVCGAGVLRAPE